MNRPPGHLSYDEHEELAGRLPKAEWSIALERWEEMLGVSLEIHSEPAT